MLKKTFLSILAFLNLSLCYSQSDYEIYRENKEKNIKTDTVYVEKSENQIIINNYYENPDDIVLDNYSYLPFFFYYNYWFYPHWYYPTYFYPKYVFSYRRNYQYHRYYNVKQHVSQNNLYQKHPDFRNSRIYSPVYEKPRLNQIKDFNQPSSSYRRSYYVENNQNKAISRTIRSESNIPLTNHRNSPNQTQIRNISNSGLRNLNNHNFVSNNSNIGSRSSSARR